MNTNQSQEKPMDPKIIKAKANELRAKLREDPTYGASLIDDPELIKQMQHNREEFMQAAKPLFDDLLKAGYKIKLLSDLYTKEIYANKVSYQGALPILLYWLPRIDLISVKWEIVHILSIKWAKPAAIPILIEEFDKISLKEGESYQYKWSIGNALSILADDSIFDEIAKLAQDKRHGNARGMIVAALGKMKNPRAVDILIGLLNDEYIGVVYNAIVALRKLKAEKAKPYIEPYLNYPEAYVRNEAKKYMAKIGKKM